MVEVFKTNVNNQTRANMLVGEIHKSFSHYSANFDLDDCDNILRIESNKDVIKASELIDYLQAFDCDAQVLPDEFNLPLESSQIVI